MTVGSIVRRSEGSVTSIPEDLLADNPEEIVRIWCTRSATLRHEYDDAICGGLLRATMDAELYKGSRLGDRIFARVERSFARVFFAKAFLKGDFERAASVGVPISGKDKALYGAAMAFIIARMVGYRLASRLPGIAGLADAHLIKRLKAQLASYGHAEFTTDSAQYKPVPAHAA